MLPLNCCVWLKPGSALNFLDSSCINAVPFGIFMYFPAFPSVIINLLAAMMLLIHGCMS